MIDETAKLDELEDILGKSIELIGYFIMKVAYNDISPDDMERFIDITGKQGVRVSELYKKLGMTNAQVAETVKIGLDVTDNNIKNS
jgi:hypothetical protein